MAEKPKEPTISVNGGPEVPMSVVKQALKVIKGAKGRAKALAAGSAQRDVEDADHAGVHPDQLQRETEVGGIAADRLRSIVHRVERLEGEKKALSSDIKDIFAEAKGAGFDVRALRQLIRMRKWDPADLEDHETLIDLYRRALGM